MHQTLYPYVEANPDAVAEACHVLGRLVAGQPLDTREYWSEAKRTEQRWDWVPALPRTIGPGSTVRVKLDAYGPTDQRRGHNGKVGVVAGIRRDVVVTYTETDEPIVGIGHHHELNKLERQVPLRPE